MREWRKNKNPNREMGEKRDGSVLFWAAGMKVRFSFCLARRGHEEIEELGSGPIKE